MNFLSRALKFTYRKKTKSILLIITFLIIGNLVITGLGINLASENAKKLTRQKMRPIVSYELDYQAINKYVESIKTDEDREKFYQNYPQISLDVAKEINKSKYVKAANTLVENIVYANGFDFIPAINPNNNEWGPKYEEDPGFQSYIDPQIRIVSNLNPSMIEFHNGDYKMVSGRFYDQNDIDNRNNVIVIEERLATLNNLRVGDTITFDMVGPNEPGFKDTYKIDPMFELEIIGIYHNNKVLDPNSQDFQWQSQYAYNNPENLMLTPSTSMMGKMEEIYNARRAQYLKDNPSDTTGYPEFDESKMYYSTTFLLKDPLDVEKFVSENKSELKSDFTKLNANDKVFKKLAKPLDTISLFSSIIVYVVLFNAIVIISLITALTLKNREYEIGVLLSIGVSKTKVIGQLVTELLIITLIGFGLATISGTIISKQIGKQVLDYQVEADNNQSENSYDDWSPSDQYFTQISQDDLLSEYEVSMSPILILQVVGIGLGIVFLSILVPLLLILRLNPRAIMLSTN